MLQFLHDGNEDNTKANIAIPWVLSENSQAKEDPEEAAF